MPNEIVEATFEEREDISIAHFVENNPFEKIVAAKVAQIREAFEDKINKGVNDISDLQVTITASGRVMSGELKIEFSIASAYGQNAVTSHTLAVALEEYFRRKGFDNRNNGLLLSRTGETMRT